MEKQKKSAGCCVNPWCICVLASVYTSHPSTQKGYGETSEGEKRDEQRYESISI